MTSLASNLHRFSIAAEFAVVKEETGLSITALYKSIGMLKNKITMFETVSKPLLT